jgi:K+-sensing histidine kinase KdpD
MGEDFGAQRAAAPASRNTWTALDRPIWPTGETMHSYPYGHLAVRWGFPVTSVALGLGVAFMLQAWDPRLTLFAFYAAVVGSAWFGTGPGCLAVFLSVLTVQYFFTPPGWGFEVMPEDVPFMGTFIVCAGMALAWASQRRRTELVLQKERDALGTAVEQRTIELNRVNDSLRAEIIERQAAEAELRETEAKLARTSQLAWHPHDVQVRRLVGTRSWFPEVNCT